MSLLFLSATKCVLINPSADLANYFCQLLRIGDCGSDCDSATSTGIRNDFHFPAELRYLLGLEEGVRGYGTQRPRQRRVNEDATLLHISCRFIVIILLKRFKLWQPLSCNLFVYCLGQGKASANTRASHSLRPRVEPSDGSNNPTIQRSSQPKPLILEGRLA